MAEYFTFNKKERLCSHVVIQRIFDQTNSFKQSPFRLAWTVNETVLEEFPAQIAISVSKRNFKKAVDRNLLKRRIREAYRLTKQSFYNILISNNLSVSFIIIYLDNKILPFSVIQQKISELLKTFAKNLTEK